MFFTIFGLIYMVDFVEMLRRAGDNPNASAALVAMLSLLRTPAISEQVLPFAVLFGAMASFITLTRKLELVVARAAGVSVWQFLTPPIVAALAIGLLAVGVYNPASALMRSTPTKSKPASSRKISSDVIRRCGFARKARTASRSCAPRHRADKGLHLGAVSAYRVRS